MAGYPRPCARAIDIFASGPEQGYLTDQVYFLQLAQPAIVL